MLFSSKPNRKVSSREQIAIKAVSDGLLVLPGNQFAIVLKVSSINFELMSEAEQDALIDVYKSFLNSLSRPFQILIRTRQMDLDSYLSSFNQKTTQEKDVQYKNQAKNYVSYVKSLVKDSKILSRSFYLVIGINLSDKDLNTIRAKLKLDTSIIKSGLNRMGISAKELSSLELLELFYSFYSPQKAKLQPLSHQLLDLMERAII